MLGGESRIVQVTGSTRFFSLALRAIQYVHVLSTHFFQWGCLIKEYLMLLVTCQRQLINERKKKAGNLFYDKNLNTDLSGNNYLDDIKCAASC